MLCVNLMCEAFVSIAISYMDKLKVLMVCELQAAVVPIND